MAPTTNTDRVDLHLKIIQEISELINHAQGLNAVLSQVVQKIAHSLQFDVVSVYLWDPALKKLAMRGNWGLNFEPGKSILLSPDEGITGSVFSKRRTIAAMPASKHPDFKYFPELGEDKYEVYLGVPILLQRKALGVLVAQTANRRSLLPAEQTLFEIIASRLAGLLEVADRLERLGEGKGAVTVQKTLQGKGVSGGPGLGPVYLFRGLLQRVPLSGFSSQGPEAEMGRFKKAANVAQQELKDFSSSMAAAGKISYHDAAIFETHSQMLEDGLFLREIEGLITEGKLSAEEATAKGSEKVAMRFESRGNPMLMERAMDVREVGERVLAALLRLSGRKIKMESPATGCVVVAKDLGPAAVARLEGNKPAALVTERGGETSHTTILARSMGIPAVVGVQGATTLLASGQQVLVDGDMGFVFVDPDPSLIEEYEKAHEENCLIQAEIIAKAKQASLPAGYQVDANVGFPSDVATAMELGIENVGLFRTEFSFMRFDGWPTVEDQIAVYREVGDLFPGDITVRTLDIGADKRLPYFTFPDEANPLLGLRSIRFSMEYPDLFRQQIRAILSLVKQGHHFRILLPMISRIWEVETAREILEETVTDLAMPPGAVPPMGIMMEVPGLYHQLEDYKDLIDFISVGTNDLIQYLLAVDRNSSVVGHLYSGYHPSVLRMMKSLKEKADFIKKDITVCGELASIPGGALALCALGYRHFSVPPFQAPGIRYLIQNVSHDFLDEVAQKILSLSHEKDIRAYLEQCIEQIDPLLLEI
ncbi:MAG: phosphoenolpyruvate--protein phosphotransferase [Desulfatibacillum sp.]|nr:phosphoenolpyruvate--protein phosphotransferase [Desulfatibacillum sp.]